MNGEKPKTETHNQTGPLDKIYVRILLQMKPA